MYPLTIELVEFLSSENASIALTDLVQADLHDTNTLTLITALRRQFSPEEAAALLDQARLRQRAREKFADADRLLFSDEALQQASSYEVARYRAQKFAGYRRVADLGSGIGADTMALAEVVPQVVAVELDPVRARLLAFNLTTRNLIGRVEVLCADWTQLELNLEAAFADPSRRAEGRRIFNLHDMQPPLAAIHRLREQVPQVAVKVMPGVLDEEIPPDAAVEFISEGGAMKEALLLFGDLRPGPARTATLLPGPHHLDSNAPVGDVSITEPQAYFYEPDAAVLRAGLVQHLAGQINAAQVDPAIAYLTSTDFVETPLARAWMIIRHGPFHLKTLNRWLRDFNAGEVVVKKRGSAVDPDPFRRRLPTTPGGETLTVFLTRCANRPWMVVGRVVVGATGSRHKD